MGNLLLDIEWGSDGNAYFSNMSESLIYALIGFAVVFAGICLIILIIYLIGLLMRKTDNLAVLTKDGRQRRKLADGYGDVEKITVDGAPSSAEATSSGAISGAVVCKSAGGGAAKTPFDVGDDVPPEVKAAIVAAVTAYYEDSGTKCEFVVRRIKKM